MANSDVVIGRLIPLNVVNNSVINAVRHAGHARVFQRRQGQLLVNRSKDHLHFYLIGIGLLPGFILFFTSHLIYGSTCELKEYPKEGEKPPHYWQFERTPLRQFISKWFATPDIEYHECWASRHSNWQVRDRWRNIEERVKHLIGERQDYKAYHYHPMSSEWVDLARRRATLLQNQYFKYERGTGRVD